MLRLKVRQTNSTTLVGDSEDSRTQQSSKDFTRAEIPATFTRANFAITCYFLSVFNGRSQQPKVVFTEIPKDPPTQISRTADQKISKN